MFSISTQQFAEKPTKKQISGITFSKKDVSIDELMKAICSGHVLSAVYRCEYPMGLSQKKESNFDHTNMIMFDSDDDISCDLQTLVDSLPIQPTIAYTTYSHLQEGKGNRYRLIYIPDHPIDSIEKYKYIYNFISKECKLNLNDNCGRSPVQQCFGTREGSSIIYTDSFLNINEILNNYKELSLGRQINNNNERKTLGLKCPPKVDDTDNEYLNDFMSIWNDEELFTKYDNQYPYFDRNYILAENEDVPLIKIPDDYIRITPRLHREPVYNNDEDIRSYTYRPLKWKDGENRRKRLFEFGIIRRFIKPDVSYEHLLHNLRKDLHLYFYNHEDTISLRELAGIADRVMNIDLDKYRPLLQRYKDRNPKHIVNRAYCAKHGMSPRQVFASFRSAERDKTMKRLFDWLKTDQENLDIFKENGLATNIKTVRRFRERHGIPEYRIRKRNISL